MLNGICYKRGNSNQGGVVCKKMYEKMLNVKIWHCFDGIIIEYKE